MNERAQRMEQWFFDEDIEEFNHATVMEELDLDNSEASAHIQAYQGYQNRKLSDSLYVIHRKSGTRTTSAVWIVGARTIDSRDVGVQLAKDLRRRVDRAIEPTLVRIGDRNARARSTTEAVGKAVESIVELMMAALVEDGEPSA